MIKFIMAVNQISNRDLYLDFVKGFLVITMVIYHTMNYFSTANWEKYAYIRFITGSFVFISGYIVSTFYERKYGKDKIGICKRLIVRGLKLLIIFTSLTLLANLIGMDSYKKWIHFSARQYFDNLGAIYIWGNSSLATFPILVPISYLLIISPVYFILYGIKKPLVTAILLLVIFFSLMRLESSILNFGMIGLVGLSVGALVNLEGLYGIKNRLIILFCLFICFSIMRYLQTNVLMYSLGILVVLKLVYDFAKTLNVRNQIIQVVILFGQYSLVCYIMQIVFLQWLFRLLRNKRWELGYETISIFVVTNMFLLGLCISLRWCRGRYRWIDKSYKVIFS